MPTDDTTFMESHPLFWLEYRQTKRSGMLIAAIAFGSLMGLYLLVFPTGLFDDPAWAMCHLVPFSFFPVSVLIVSLGPMRKIADQQLGDDLVLQTPLTPFQTISEKFGIGLLHALILYGPTVPGALLCLLDENPYWFAGCLFDFILSMSLLSTGIGFMAGAKTVLKTAILVFFGAVYVITGIAIGSVIAISCEEILRFNYSDPATTLIPWFFSTVFIAFAGLIGFTIGVLTFRSTGRSKIVADAGFIIAFLVLYALTGLLIATSEDHPAGGLIVMFFTELIFLGMPYAAVCMAYWNRN